jgi:hypothetical protein
VTTLDEDWKNADLLHRSAALRAWSEVLIARSLQARRTATEAGRQSGRRRAKEMSPAIEPVAISELFTILVDHHGLGVLDAVRCLAVQMAAAGYPEETDFVSASDAVEITHSILALP